MVRPPRFQPPHGKALAAAPQGASLRLPRRRRARLARKKQEVRRPENAIQAIFRGEVTEEQITEAHLKTVCRAFQSSKSCPRTRRAFLDLLTHAGPRADFFATQPVIASTVGSTATRSSASLLALARHAADWLRPVEEWKPQTHNARRQFASLARHLFARWPVPAFMDSVWFKGVTAQAFRSSAGSCTSVGARTSARRTCRCRTRSAWPTTSCRPRLTSRSRRRCAGARSTDSAATSGWRGRSSAPASGRLRARRLLDHGAPVLYRQPDAGHGPRRPGHRLHPPAAVRPAGGLRRPRRCRAEVAAPAQLQHEGAHASEPAAAGGVVAQNAGEGAAPQAEWPHSGIAGFEFVEGSERGGNVKIWTITELLSTKALFAEGRTMKHCVATYARSCAHGDCSIWTLEVWTLEGRSKMLTIEVRRDTKLICQVRGKCNALAAEKHRGVLRRWAEQAGLRLAGYV